MKTGNDTIVAVSTPPGEAGISVIRMSGDRAISIVERVFRVESGKPKWTSHRARKGWVYDREEPVDEVVCIFFRSPRSYTGEDVVELSCHGGSFVSRRIMELMIAEGARPAGPGEFTQRAFLNGKMDLAQAEAVAEIIRAKTEASRRVATYQLTGLLTARLNEMRERLIKANALLELELDFAEEDARFASREQLTEDLQDMAAALTTLRDSYDRGRVCKEGIRMVILGRPNVGKSSILNCLLERERAIVTEYPGTTRDTVEDVLDIEGILFTITDTAGIRCTPDPVEKEGIRRADTALSGSDLVLLVFDGSEALNADDEDVIRRVNASGKRVIALINKTDLANRIEIPALKKRVPGAEFLCVSARTMDGISALIDRLEASVLSGGFPHHGEVILTSLRHRDCVERAIDRIRFAESSLREGMSQEFVALDLRGALEAVGEITGETTDDDILNRIFSDFCVGK